MLCVARKRVTVADEVMHMTCESADCLEVDECSPASRIAQRILYTSRWNEYRESIVVQKRPVSRFMETVARSSSLWSVVRAYMDPPHPRSDVPRWYNRGRKGQSTLFFWNFSFTYPYPFPSAFHALRREQNVVLQLAMLAYPPPRDLSTAMQDLATSSLSESHLMTLIALGWNPAKHDGNLAYALESIANERNCNKLEQIVEMFSPFSVKALSDLMHRASPDKVPFLLDRGAQIKADSPVVAKAIEEKNVEILLRLLESQSLKKRYIGIFQVRLAAKHESWECLHLLLDNTRKFWERQLEYKNPRARERWRTAVLKSMDAVAASSEPLRIKDVVPYYPFWGTGDTLYSIFGVHPDSMQYKTELALVRSGFGGYEVSNALLLRAIKSRHVDEVEELIRLGADINCYCGMPLLHAIESFQTRMAVLLIESGAKVAGDDGKAAYHSAYQMGDVRIMKLLEKHGACPDYRPRRW